MKYEIEIRSIWEFGQRVDKEGHPHQEDSIFPHHQEFNPEIDRVFLLCDGMGGLDAGEVASAAVCDAMAQHLQRFSATEPFVCTPEDIKSALTEAYAALDKVGKGTKMGTTMTCLVLHSQGAIIAHIGDSRVYHVRPGQDADSTQILFQTTDHSLVNDLVKIGEITPEEARTHPRRNILTRAMQPGEDNRCSADIAPAITDIKVGDFFFLCSDGILEGMDDNTIKYLFSEKTADIDNKTRVIREATKHNKDNHSALLIHITAVSDEDCLKEQKNQSKNVDSGPSPESISQAPQISGESTKFSSDKVSESPQSPAVSHEKKGFANWLKDLF